LIPHRAGFEAGYLRTVLNQASISNPGFCNLRLSSWIENAILMPAASGVRWAELANVIGAGRQYLPKKQRISVVYNLSEGIKWLEGQDISHRGLSSTNVYVDAQKGNVHLVDWDAMFHPALQRPDNLTHVATGYIPPFVKVKGYSDARNTWRRCADRFGLTLMNAEILSLGTDFPLKEEGTTWDQDEIYNRSGPYLTSIIDGLRAQFPKAAVLLEQSLEATSFDDCPAPVDWIAALGSESAIKAKPIPVRDRPAFVGLNKAGFTKLNKTVLVGLKRHAFVKPPHR
jgi:serine/threonine protein kinase